MWKGDPGESRRQEQSLDLEGCLSYSDGTVAVDMDPLSLLCRLATSVPAPRLHTIRYAGVLGPANPWRSRLAPQPPQGPAAASGVALGA